MDHPRLPGAAVWLAPLANALAGAGYDLDPEAGSDTLVIRHGDPSGADIAAGNATVSIWLRQSPDDRLFLVALDAKYLFDSSAADSMFADDALRQVEARLPFGALHVDDDGRVHLTWTVPAPRGTTLGEPELIRAIIAFDEVQEHFGDYIELICTEGATPTRIAAVMDAFGD